MKNIRVTHIIIVLMLLLVAGTNASAQSYDKLWKSVEAAEKDNLPQSTVTAADKIIAKAKAEGNMPQLLKASVLRASRIVVPDSIYTEIAAMEELAAQTVDTAHRAVVSSVLMKMYADCATSHIISLRRRTAVVGEEPSADMREWSGNIYAERVRALALASLTDKSTLLPVSSSEYLPFVIQADGSKYYSHSLYHLLASRAIDVLDNVSYYSSGTDYSNEVDSIYREMLSAYKENGNYADGYVLTAVDYQKWLRKHGGALSTKELNARYTSALNTLITDNADSRTCVEAYIARALQLVGEKKNVEAMAICDEGISRYSSYNRINALKEVRAGILTPALNIWVESVDYPGKDIRLLVSHRNLSGFTLHVQSGDKTVKSVKFALNRPADYASTDTTLFFSIPNPGEYTLKAVADGANAVERTINISRLKAFSLSLPGQQEEVVVVDAHTGLPVDGASVSLVSRQGKEVDCFSTDADGRVVFPWKNTYYNVKAVKGDDASLPATFIYYSNVFGKNVNRSTAEVRLLTDRSIYRPGQTVYVKGVSYKHYTDRASVKAGEQITVTLSDANGQELASHDVVGNEFGSFTTEFALPGVCLNGVFSLHTSAGATTIRVEEYKRPTFSIDFYALSGSYTLGSDVELTGVAQTYSGVPMSGQKMLYTVRRSMFRWWRGSSVAGDVIATDSVAIDADGRFSIPLSLKPERKDDEGYYTFTVEAVLTSMTGETQTATYTVNAGRSSLLLRVDVPQRLCIDSPENVIFHALNMNGEDVDLRGKYSLYRVTDKDTTLVNVGLDVPANKALEPTEMWASLPSGGYLLKFAATDDQGKEAVAEAEFALFRDSDKRPPVYSEEWYKEDNLSFDADHPARFSYGTSMSDVYMLMRVFSKDKLLESRQMSLTDTIMRFDMPYREEYGDGVNVLFTYIKDGKPFSRTVRITRRLPDRNLTLAWSTFRDKLRPGSSESWSLTVSDAQGAPADAEVLATMYDASLDKIYPKNQTLGLSFYLNVPTSAWQIGSYSNKSFYFNFSGASFKYPALQFDSFYKPASTSLYGGQLKIRGQSLYSSGAVSGKLMAVTVKQKASVASNAMEDMAEAITADMDIEQGEGDDGAEEEAAISADDLRTNLAETAFFYPMLRTDSVGRVVIDFTVPESLTEWHFNAYAHTKDMCTGMLSALAQTKKELMVQPNVPRFVRRADRTTISASIANLSEKRQAGTATFTLFNPYDEKVLKSIKRKFVAEAGATVAVDFEFDVPDGYDLLGCRVVAAGADYSDGEQHLLPVLSDKSHLRETVVMTVVGDGAKKSYQTDALFNGHSASATGRELTIELTGNPAWYAVQALPSIAQPVCDDAISWASAYYANSISAHIVAANENIRSVVESWKSAPAAKETFRSNLQKNEELKGVLLGETPWVLEAKSEEEQRERVASLFNTNNINLSLNAAQQKLKTMQLSDGSWAWYNGMRGSRYVTLYIAELNARAALLTGSMLTGDMKTMQQRAMDYLHSEMAGDYSKLSKSARSDYSLSYNELRYLYLVAISGNAVAEKYSSAYRFYLSKAANALHGKDMAAMAMAAIVLRKSGSTDEAGKLINSMREHLSTDADGAISFAFNEVPGSFSGRRLSAHVMAMEAFATVAAAEADDSLNDVVEGMKLWLLKQKRTQEWNSSVTTADAVYALLMRGDSLLTVDSKLTATMGTAKVSTTDADAVGGMGYVKRTFTETSALDARSLKLEKSGEGMAWGAVYAQCDDKIDAVETQSSGIAVSRSLYVERVSVGGGKSLVAIDGADAGSLKVGDKLVVRTVINVSATMDFVMLKEGSAACLEPVESISGYRWNSGCAYYAEVKDASTNLYFDRLTKGVYVVENSYRVSRRGRYQAGITTVQCVYSPEYAAHTAGASLKVE